MQLDQTRTVRPRTTAGLLAIVGPAMLLVVISSDMVTLVLPMIGSTYGVAKAELAWMVTGFLLTFSIGIPFYGRVADRLSLRSLYVGTLLVFTAGSVVAALAPGFVPIVLGRVIMGAGGAAIPVLSVVAVMRLLPRDRRAVGFGLLGAVGGTGAALGPAFGGVIGQLIGWRGLFWCTAGLALALLPGVLRGLPATPGEDRRPIDVAGGLLLGSSIGALLLGVTQAQTNGFGSPASWPLIIAAPVLAALFGWRLRTAAHPFVTPGLFAHRAFTAATLTVLLAMAVNLATLVFVPTMIIEENALTPGQASLIMIPGGVALGLLSPVAGRLMGRYGPRPLVLGGLIMIGAAMLTLTFGAGASPALIAAAVTGLGAGFAFVITNVTAVAAESQPPELAGAGLGIFQGAQFLGAGTGPALAGVLLDARHGTDPVLPWYTLGAPAYSDLFLGLTVVTLVALVIAARTLRSRT